MTVKVIFELKLQDGKTSELVQMVREALPVTRQYDGCKHVDLCLGLDDTTQVILTQEWESKEKHLAYIQFRTEDGSLDKIRAIVKEEPKMSYFDIQTYDLKLTTAKSATAFTYFTKSKGAGYNRIAENSAPPPNENLRPRKIDLSTLIYGCM